ncbi:hypothetical protein SLS62_002429 [Diatrype stigma]|uniref:SET domain-containing protein n=1 Tax=Diatrype stigma TaxID=117547 RepID=A0AAN9UYH0_9PEZI
MDSRRSGTASLLQAAQQLLLAASLVRPTRGATEIQLAAVARECPTKIHASLQPHGRFGCALALDEETVGPHSQPVDWSPWTHPPECLATNAHSNVTKYCLYTNSAHGHYGVSLIATPETAANAAEMLDDFNADFLRPIGSQINVPRRSGNGTAVQDGTRASDGNNDDNDRPYEVVDMPGKGKGVVARRRIARAEVVMVDFASIVLDLAFPRAVRRLDGYDLLDQAVRQLGDPERVLNLARKREHPPNMVEDVLRTNSFHFELDEKPHMALFADIAVESPPSSPTLPSRGLESMDADGFADTTKYDSESTTIVDQSECSLHIGTMDCSVVFRAELTSYALPSAYFQSSQSSLAARVIAFRDIKPGEEITISYIDLGKTYPERQKALQRWDFSCDCEMCRAPASETAASDARRLRIRALRGDVLKALAPSPGRDVRGAIEMAEEVLALVRREELRGLYAEQHDTLGRLYWAAGDRALGLEHARISLEVLEDVGYIEHDDAHLPKLLGTYGELGVGSSSGAAMDTGRGG